MAIKIHCDPEAGAVYLRLSDSQNLGSQENDSGIVVDDDARAKIVALEFLNARETVAPETIAGFGKAA